MHHFLFIPHPTFSNIRLHQYQTLQLTASVVRSFQYSKFDEIDFTGVCATINLKLSKLIFFSVRHSVNF